MAVRNVLVSASPQDVWAVLADGWSYDRWVVGTTAIRGVDRDWPAEGTSLEYTVGLGPVHLDDLTTVRIAEPRRRLELEANAWPLGTARISIEVLPWGQDSVVVIDEHPLRGPGWHLQNPLLEMALSLRNRRMVHNLAELVESRVPAPRRPDHHRPDQRRAERGRPAVSTR